VRNKPENFPTPSVILPLDESESSVPNSSMNSSISLS
jgi:hypothetical protein